MKLNTILNLSLFAALVVPALAGAQANTVDHVSSRGYTQTTYFSAPGVSAMFTISQSTRVNGGPEKAFFATGSAMAWLPGGRLVVIVADSGDADGGAQPSSRSLKTPGSAWASIPARRMEYQLGPGGIQMTSNIPGTMNGWSILQDPQIVDGTRDVDQNHLTLPGIGLVFSVHGVYGGKLGFTPTGMGGFDFTPTGGIPETYFTAGTAVDSASWMGWLHSSETVVVKN